jgi:hypothetical protein
MKRGLIAGAVVAIGLLFGAAWLALPPRVSPEAIAASVTRTPELIDRAWKLPAAAAIGADIDWQSNGSLCGPASLANVFRSLGEEETSEDAVLDGTGKCWIGICWDGLTLDELAEVARTKTERKVTVLRDLTAEEFRDEMRRSNDPDRRIVVNFARKPIFGAGVGHHSPIGGYLEAEDMVFVLDVNEDFRPWLIERERLFRAMDTLDGDTKRGLLVIE